MSGVAARVAQLRAGLESRRPQAPRQPVRRHRVVRWLRRPLLGGPPARTGAPSPFMAGLDDGRREGYEAGYPDGWRDGHAAGFRDGAGSAGEG